MRRPITPFVHGVVDYVTAAMMPMLPRVLRSGRGATTVMDCAGATSLMYALATKYELGVCKLLPMRDHLKIDALQGGALIASSLLLDDEDTCTRATLAGLGTFALAMSMLTQDESSNDPGVRVRPGAVKETERGLVGAAEHI